SGPSALDLAADASGRAAARVAVSAFALDQPLSIVVSEAGTRVACGDLVPPGRLDLSVAPDAGAGVTGSAWLPTIDGATFVHLDAAGLAPGSWHAARLDLGSCAGQLGDFRYDPAGPATRTNEVWLDLVAGRDGRASATV